MFCEKLVCKYIQTLFTATKNKWKDSFYNKLSGLYKCCTWWGWGNFPTENNFHWCYNNEPEVSFQYFYICGTSKISNTRINWLFSIRTKNKTITKSNRNIRKTNAVKKFKPIYSFNISVKSDTHRCLLNLSNLDVKTLDKSDRLSKKDIKMDCRNNVLKEKEKRHKSKLFQASLNATDKLGSKKMLIYVNDKLALMPLNVDYRRSQDQIYFKSPDNEK